MESSGRQRDRKTREPEHPFQKLMKHLCIPWTMNSSLRWSRNTMTTARPASARLRSAREITTLNMSSWICFQVSVKDLMSKDGKSIATTLNLIYKGKPKGRLSFKGEIRESGTSLSSTEPSATKDATATDKKPKESGKLKPFTTGTLHVKKILCNSLPNVEVMMGKNDVYVEIELVGDMKKTSVQDEVGSDAVFDFVNMNFAVDESILRFESLKIRVKDSNTLREHVLIGSAETSLASMMESPYDQELTFRLTLANEKYPKQNRGSVTLVMSLTELTTEPEAKISPEFQGLISFTRLCVYDAHYVKATISNQLSEPYAKLKVGSWSQWIENNSTGKSKKIHGDIVFDELDIITEVTGGTINTTPVCVELWDNFMGKGNLVGSGTVSVEKAGAKPGEEIVFEFPLSSNGATAGKAALYVTITPHQDEKKLSIPKEFKEAMFRIESIAAHGLKKVEFFGKQVSRESLTTLHCIELISFRILTSF